MIAAFAFVPNTDDGLSEYRGKEMPRELRINSARSQWKSWATPWRILLLTTTLAVLVLTVLALRDFGVAPTEIPEWVNYPGSEWQTITPEQAGLNVEKFNAWVKSQTPRFGKATGGQKPDGGGVVITRAGYILHTWGDPDFKFQSASLGKTFTRMALQLAVDKGLVRSARDLVKDYWTGAGQLAPHKVMTQGHNAEVRFIHLQEMRAGFPVTNGWFWKTRDPTGMIGSTEIPSWAKYTGNPDYDNYAHITPGRTRRYSSGGYWRFSQALTAVWQKDLKKVLDEHIMSVIGIPPDRWDWPYGEAIRTDRTFYPQMPGYGDYMDPPYRIKGVRVRGGPGWVVMSAKDFARLGLLIATGGVWNGERLISGLGGNVGVGAHTVDGWGVVKRKPGYFSFGKVATGFSDPTPELMASWIVSAPKGSVTVRPGYRRIQNNAVGMRNGEILRMFEDERKIERAFGEYFDRFIMGSQEDDCFGEALNVFLVVCQRKAW